MKAITLHQPWASLVASGHKTIETRSWSTKHRGPIAIHAAKDPRPSETFAGQAITTGRLSTAEWNAMPFGAVVAIAELADVVDTDRLEWGLRRGQWRDEQRQDGMIMVADGQRPLGDYRPNRFAWLLQDIRPLDPPRPATGKQGLWTWEVVPT